MLTASSCCCFVIFTVATPKIQSDQFNNDDYAISFHSQLVVTTTHREIIEKKGRKS